VVEYLRFLTERGVGGELGSGAGWHKNKPVLLWAHDSVITQKEAEMNLGFKYIERRQAVT
jgi:hypothetical protein